MLKLTDQPSVAAVARSRANSLSAGERRVCEAILGDIAWAVEATTTQIGDAAGVSSATVVRTAKSLGYRGFPHLQVMLARDLGTPRPAADDATPAGLVRAFFEMVAASAAEMAQLLSDQRIDAVVAALVAAPRILIGGNGVSAPVAQDFAMRLAALGRPASAPTDALDQQIRARLLGPGDVCVIVSGTGATSNSLRAAAAADAAGATVVAMTSFAQTPLSALADIELVVG
ncbi:MAG: MurR/RpiR family transcriptional regulator, partial [Bifidobacteriaceae bacterium]|nr:MurR/RpiR family transcriptional regulator [Bifidobacteriaceae bacterium]